MTENELMQLPVFLCKFTQFFHNIRIPVYDRGQPVTGELVAYTAELYIMPPCARMYFTSAAFCPFWHIAVRFNTAFTYSIQFLPAAVTAFAAGSYCSKIYLLFHSVFTSHDAFLDHGITAACTARGHSSM